MSLVSRATRADPGGNLVLAPACMQQTRFTYTGAFHGALALPLSRVPTVALTGITERQTGHTSPQSGDGEGDGVLEGGITTSGLSQLHRASHLMRLLMGCPAAMAASAASVQRCGTEAAVPSGDLPGVA
mmetsp:Transcript_5593/g.16003  ORF Transcript_5593/g.16003 Transcript_5593/m.16003 type:complete len:129 (-) Transcript_5593:3402-3788(-)